MTERARQREPGERPGRRATPVGRPPDDGVEVALDCANRLGESVLWDADRGEVIWVNIHDGEIWRHQPARGTVRVHALPERVGAIGLMAGPRLVVALASGFACYDTSAEALDRLQDVEPALPTTRLNDGRVDRQGRFVCGGMDEAVNQAPISAVYRLDRDGTVQRLISGIRCANSICFSLDGSTMYFSDMPTGRIVAYRYDIDTGLPHSPRLFADTSGQPGLPDGSVVDAEGFLWNARWQGGHVIRYAPDGRVDRVLALPVTNATCLAFGGADLATLYVTTARFGLTPGQLDREPLAGCLLAAQPGVRGVPEPRYVLQAPS